MKWIGLTIMLIPLFKWLAYLERGYRAYGEELCVIGFVILLYSVLHSEPYLAWRERCRNKRRLKRLAERRIYYEKI